VIQLTAIKLYVSENWPRRGAFKSYAILMSPPGKKSGVWFEMPDRPVDDLGVQRGQLDIFASGLGTKLNLAAFPATGFY
jgi:hypothetical protein